jgi:hypothetical protein
VHTSHTRICIRCRNHQTTGFACPPGVPCTCSRRTLGSNRLVLADWRARDGPRIDPTGTTSYSVINDCLLGGPSSTDETRILDLAPPCSLHLMLGVNEGLGHLNKQLPENLLQDWLRFTLNIEYEPYFGGKTLGL